MCNAEPLLVGSWWSKRALSRQNPGSDNAFSLEPHEFKEMVDAIRTVEKALGKISYEITEKQKESRVFRSLVEVGLVKICFVVRE